MSNRNLTKNFIFSRWVGLLFLLLMFIGVQLGLPPLCGAADEGTYFEVKDDLTVSGTEGTKNDADLEVKGVSSFAKDIFIEAGILAGPYGGLGTYENMLTYSEALDNAAWTKATLTAADGQTAPDATTNADLLTNNGAANGTATQAKSASASTAYTFSIWLSSGTSTGAQIELVGNGTGDTATAQAVTLTVSWKRFSVTHTTVADAATITATVKNTGADVTTIKAWGGQLEASSTPGVYARATSSAISASRGIVSTGDILMPSLKLSGGTITDTTGTVTVGSNLASTGNLQVTGAGPHYISQGNVGIGTTAPASGLDVQTAYPQVTLGKTAQAGSIHFRRGSDGVGVGQIGYINAGSNTFSIQQAGGGAPLEISSTAVGGYITFNNVGSEKMRITSTGNVGIGTTVPAAKLEVVGTSSQMQLAIKSYSSQGPYLAGFFNASGVQTLAISADGGITNTSSDLVLGSSSNSVTFRPAGSEKMRIDTSGNVGIGTTAPVSQLQIGHYTRATNNVLALLGENITNHTIRLADESASWGFDIVGHGGGYLDFVRHNSNSTGVSAMRIMRADGNVGISETTPTAKLHVVGGATSNDYAAKFYCGTDLAAWIKKK